MTITRNKHRRHRLRQLAYIPLIVAAAAVIGTSVGAGSAASATTPVPTDVFSYDWTLVNRTGQPIYGTWNITVTAGNNSSVAAPANRPWRPDDNASATQFQRLSDTTTWRGHICYNNHWWGFTHSQDFGYFEIFDIPVFSVEADSRGALFVYPFPTNRAVRIALNPQNGDCT
ncbi:hypothetical protein R3Q06_34985 [Rhodococcus erythropolis]|uniref:hypothetical protein n=1 Tax=Rhodococcus erythropolis TaxID=1833 RepID=UPI002949A2AF|nr:hypothetical protein [Rhodococcus erythropolis]MDV6278598.1 hypothetical protein [Rhodococcus erythropolis]